MAAVFLFFSLWTFVSASVLVSASKDQNILTAEPGDTVNLTCKVCSSINILLVEWTKPDLEPNYVFFYRDGQSDPENQHLSYINRVELKDKQMKDGDVSVILKNVTNNDNGRYECHVISRETDRRKRSTFKTEPIEIINLTVQPGGDKDGGDKDGGDKDDGDKDRSRQCIGVIAGSLFTIVVFGLVLRIFRSKRMNSPLPSADEMCEKHLVSRVTQPQRVHKLLIPLVPVPSPDRMGRAKSQSSSKVTGIK